MASVLPETRRRPLRVALEHSTVQREPVRLLEAHNGLSALVGAWASSNGRGSTKAFAGTWISSLTECASKGFPDEEILGFASRLAVVEEVVRVSPLPLVVDGDSGGDQAHFAFMVRSLERHGVSAVIIEDQRFPKRNSLDTRAQHTLEDPATFAKKIAWGCAARLTTDCLIIARIESFIAGAGLEDALARASIYIEAGADAIMIHSRRSDPSEVFAFSRAFQTRHGERTVPLVCVPTTYNQTTDGALFAAGFKIIIHANHLLRSALKAMQDTARTILSADRSWECNPQCVAVSELITPVQGFQRQGASTLPNKDTDGHITATL